MADIGPTVGQGTNSGSILSAVSLDGGIREYFPIENIVETKEFETKKEENIEKKKREIAKYDNIELNPFLYQDDIGVLSDTVEAAQDTNERIEALMESKLLDLHKTKSKFIVLSKKKEREKMRKEVEENPIRLYGNAMTEGKVEKYLGFYIAATAAESVAATVDKRIGLATKAIFEARAIIEDSRSESIGGFTVMLDIFNLSICPMLY